MITRGRIRGLATVLAALAWTVATPAAQGDPIPLRPLSAGSSTDPMLEPHGARIEPVLFRKKRIRVYAAPMECVPAIEPMPIAPSPVAPPPPMPPTAPLEPTIPTPAEAPQTTDELASSLETASAPRSLSPNMLGDYIGYVYAGNPRPQGSALSPGEAAETRILRRYKAADNTSPIPYSRVSYSYNYFKDAFDTVGDVSRHFGIVEWAFVRDLASIELKGSLNAFSNFEDVENSTDVGDLRTTLKGVLYRNEDWLVSGGLAIGLPTAPRPQGVPAGNYIVAPFLGYLIAAPNRSWYLQGFQQLDLPTEEEDQILMHTDIGAGYWLRRGDMSRWITGIAPTFELHLYTPIGEAPHDQLAGLVYRDVLNATLGGTIVIGENLFVAAGLGVPISTQKDYDIEAQFHITWRF